MVAPSQELPPWGQALAGSAAAIWANILVYPLDIVKTRLQVQVKKKEGSPVDKDHYESTWHAIAKIMEEEGVTGLYSGMASSLFGTASMNFAYFYWYSVVRVVYNKYDVFPKPTNTAIELSLGAVAGALAQLFTIPIAVITTRQQTQPRGQKRGMLETAQEVIESEDGWTGLWRGLKASLVLVVNPSITYGAYQRLKDVMFPNKLVLAPWEAFLLGAMSKSLATIVTQPMIVAKVRLQSRPPPERNGVPFKSFTEVIAYASKQEGPLSLFSGLAPQLLKGLLVQGLLMMAKEKIDLLFVLLFSYARQIRKEKLAQLAEIAKQKAAEVAPEALKA